MTRLRVTAADLPPIPVTRVPPLNSGTIFDGVGRSYGEIEIGDEVVVTRTVHDYGCDVWMDFRKPPTDPTDERVVVGGGILSGPLPANYLIVDVPEPSLCPDHWHAWSEVVGGIPDEWKRNTR